MVNTVTVLLAAYNGMPYLKEQVASLEKQTVPFRVLMQDDGSTDGTPDFLRETAARDPRFTFGPHQGERLGAARNFFSLLSAARGRVALCDQDDLWAADKLEKLSLVMDRAEAEYGEDTPLLVHSDLQVVDERGALLHASFFAHQKWDPGAVSLPRLLVQNNATGCAMLINESLRALVAGHAPEKAFMHDWFIAQSAAAFGRILFVPEALVSYRQHGDNAIGASTRGMAGRLLRAVAMPSRAKARIRVNDTQAACLLESYGESLPAPQRKIIEDYLAIARRPKPLRPFLLKKGDYLMQDPTLRLGQYLLT